MEGLFEAANTLDRSGFACMDLLAKQVHFEPISIMDIDAVAMVYKPDEYDTIIT